MQNAGRKDHAGARVLFWESIKYGWPKALRIASLCVLLAGVCSRAPATQVDLGYIGVYAPD